THHYQFNRLNEGIAGHRADEITGRTSLKRQIRLRRSVVIGNNRDAAVWMLFLHQFDLFGREIEIIAGVNNQEQQLLRPDSTRKFIETRDRRQNAKILRAQDSYNT